MVTTITILDCNFPHLLLLLSFPYVIYFNVWNNKTQGIFVLFLRSKLCDKVFHFLLVSYKFEYNNPQSLKEIKLYFRSLSMPSNFK